MLLYIALKQISSKVNRIVFARNERAARENMRDDKIYVSYQCVQSCTPTHLCVPRNWWLSENGLHNEHRDSRGRKRTREKGKVDRDKADAIITIFFYTSRIPSWKLRGLPSTTRRVASLP